MIKNLLKGNAMTALARSFAGGRTTPINCRYILAPSSLAPAIFLLNKPQYYFCSNEKKPQPEQDPQKKKKQDQKKVGNEEQEEIQKQPTWKQKLDDFIANFWEKPDPSQPYKKIPSKPQQLIMKLSALIQYLMQKMVSTVHYKFYLKHLVLLLMAIYLINRYMGHQKQISSQRFIQLLKMGSFAQIQFIEQEYFKNTKATFKKIVGKTDSERFYCQVMSFEQVLKIVMADDKIRYKNIRRTNLESFFHKIYYASDIILMVLIIGSIMRQTKGGMGGMGGRAQMGPKQKKFDVIKDVPTRFADVAGLEQSKRQVQEVVDFLKNPAKYQALGANIPKGVLLTGPPGTGKTLLAKSCAGEAGVPFFSVSGSDFVQVFVGVGASRVRQLFQQAKQQSPAIIFVDQLDAVGKKRQNKMGSNDERQSTLNQLLVEMDGFGTNNNVIVMAATNRKDVLDGALVRPGRFDREVQVGLPDLKGRYQILLVHLRPLVLSPKYSVQEYAKRIASLSPGFSGAQLANLCNQAAILASRCQKQHVEMLDFELSSERVIGGVERKGFVNVRQKKTVAYHQSGHAVVSWFLEGADPLLKVTIIPRSKGALGFAQYFLNENQLQTKQQLLDRICFILGGRCSQLFFFKQITTGAYDDLEKAYNLAYHIVAKFGMDKDVGNIAFPDPQYTKPYGEKVESMIDAEIKKIIGECTVRTNMMIQKHAQDIKSLAQQLLVKETMDVRSIRRILGDRPFPVNRTFEAYLQTEQTQ